MIPSVLIVGAGPTGLAAALELARRGVPPRLVDAGPGPTPEGESRALGVLPPTLAILDPAGVGAELRAAGNPIRRLVFREDGRGLASASFDELPFPDRSILVVPQGRTERLLLDALASHGIAPEWNTCLTGLELAGRPRATLETGGGAETAAFDRVLGCDGARSAVRRLAGIPFAGEATETEWGLADVSLVAPADPSTATACFHSAGGAYGVIPIDARTRRFVGSHPDMAARARAHAPVTAILWSSRFRVEFRMVSTFAAGPVLLAGDAAHVHSPVGARGMNLGIEDAAWAAWAIAEGREAEYSPARLPVARRTLSETRAQTRAVLGASFGMRLLRRQVPPLVLAVPRLRRRALARVLGLDRPPPPWLGRSGRTRG